MPAANSNVTEDWCVSRVNTIKHSLTWTVEDLSKFPAERTIKSSQFPSRGEHIKWTLTLITPTFNKDQKYYSNIKVYLNEVENQARSCFSADYNISLLNNKREELATSGKVEWRPRYSSTNKSEISRGIKLTQDQLPDDNLTIYCELDRIEISDELCGPVLDVPPAIPRQMDENIGDLFQNQMFSDVSIHLGSTELKAHKAILAARSPVFKAMFSHNMLESQSNRVEVTDIEPHVFEEVLRYIYTGKSSLEKGSQCSFAIDVLKAATKYQLDGLKIFCEHYLNSQLSLDSIIEILLSGDQCQSVWLKKRAIDFSLSHANELSERDAWMSLADANPGLLAEILQMQCEGPSNKSSKGDSN